MTEHIARFKPGKDVPVYAETQLLAGRFATISGGKNAYGAYKANHSTANGRTDGVIELDSAPTTFPEHSTDRVRNLCRTGAIHYVEAASAITADAEVAVGAAGKAKAAASTNTVVGRALTAAAGDGSIIEVLTYDTGGQYVKA
jgi:hypothetical protein